MKKLQRISALKDYPSGEISKMLDHNQGRRSYTENQIVHLQLLAAKILPEESAAIHLPQKYPYEGRKFCKFNILTGSLYQNFNRGFENQKKFSKSYP